MHRAIFGPDAYFSGVCRRFISPKPLTDPDGIKIDLIKLDKLVNRSNPGKLEEPMANDKETLHAKTV
jgi:hypothetical protein